MFYDFNQNADGLISGDIIPGKNHFGYYYLTICIIKSFQFRIFIKTAKSFSAAMLIIVNRNHKGANGNQFTLIIDKLRG